MAAKPDSKAAKGEGKRSLNIDLSGIQQQFDGLDMNNPGLWPPIPKAVALFMTVVFMVGLGWLLQWQGQTEELEAAQSEERRLKDDYKDKVSQAANLAALIKQREQVAEYVTALEKQLPSKAEMDALLSDINQAGIGRGLQFELFKPGQQQIKEYYAELPINVRVLGTYHDIGSFVSDVANMPRIVTLNDMNLSAQRDGMTLSLDATAKTFRYLDNDEVATQRKEAAKAKGGKG